MIPWASKRFSLSAWSSRRHVWCGRWLHHRQTVGAGWKWQRKPCQRRAVESAGCVCQLREREREFCLIQSNSWHLLTTCLVHRVVWINANFRVFQISIWNLFTVLFSRKCFPSLGKKSQDLKRYLKRSKWSIEIFLGYSIRPGRI